MGKGAGSGPSGRDTFWARHAIFLHERRLKPRKQSFPFVQKDQPESTWRSPKSQSALGYCSIENRFQILASCMEETPKKIVGNNCFQCSFPLIPQTRIRVLGKSSVDIAHLTERAVEIDFSVFSSSDPFVCNSCYKRLLRLLRFEKKLICDPFRRR